MLVRREGQPTKSVANRENRCTTPQRSVDDDIRELDQRRLFC